MLNRFLKPRGILILAFLAASPTVAMAYIDPGNGAYMVQALFTLLGAALFYVRHPVRTAKLIWNRLRGRSGGDEATAVDESLTEGAPAANDSAVTGAERAAQAAAVQKQQG
jgi:hypothetical protein